MIHIELLDIVDPQHTTANKSFPSALEQKVLLCSLLTDLPPPPQKKASWSPSPPGRNEALESVLQNRIGAVNHAVLSLRCQGKQQSPPNPFRETLRCKFTIAVPGTTARGCGGEGVAFAPPTSSRLLHPPLSHCQLSRASLEQLFQRMPPRWSPPPQGSASQPPPPPRRRPPNFSAPTFSPCSASGTCAAAR